MECIFRDQPHWLPNGHTAATSSDISGNPLAIRIDNGIRAAGAIWTRRRPGNSVIPVAFISKVPVSGEY